MLILAAVNTVFLSIVPILAALLLVIVCTLVLSRRATRVAEFKANLERQLEGTLQRDAQIAHEFADGIISGVSTEEAIVHFQNDRANLLPTANPDAPYLWSIEQLKNWRREQLDQGIEQVNRRMVVASVGVSVLIVAVAVVSVGTLYHFESTTEPIPTSGDFRDLPPAIPAAIPPAPSAIPLPVIPPADQPSGGEPAESRSQPNSPPSPTGANATQRPPRERTVL